LPEKHRCLPENACGPFLHGRSLPRGANRPEPHHYAKNRLRRQCRNLLGVYSWLPLRGRAILRRLTVPQLVHLNVNPDLKRLPARFYRSDSGREPVRAWLKSLDAEDRRIIGEDIKDVEFSWPIGMPLVRPLGRELWEVRSSLPHGRTARVLFCAEQDCMVLLHRFMKKTQKTSQRDIDLAIRRKKGTGA